MSRNMKSNLHEKTSFQVPKAKRKGETQPRGNYVVEQDYIGHKDFQRPLRVLKRASPYHSSLLETCTGNTQNTKALNMEGKRQKVHLSGIIKKVDPVAYPRKILSGKYTHDLLYKRSRGYGDLERANIRNAIITDCSVAERSEQNNSDNDACSVGSCSVEDEAENKFHNCSIELPCLDRDLLFTDAESFDCTGHKETCYRSLEEKVGITIHGLEMHAYRCTLEALYASGPLSWEQEELLTNLRIMLNISNDEHLTELRNLIPPGSSK